MENKYFLAVETKPKDYFPINLPELKIAQNFNSTKLEEIDNFTLKYTNKEIKTAIQESNLLQIDDNMPLVIIYAEKNSIRKIPVLTKEIAFNMWENLKNNFQNKNFLNTIYNFLKSKTTEDLTALKSPSNIEEYLKQIGSLSYPLKRKLYFYLYEK